MAVEARHLCAPQILCNRDMMMMNSFEGSGGGGGNGNLYYDVSAPFSGKAEAPIPVAGDFAAPISRKRSRDLTLINPLLSNFQIQNQIAAANNNNNNRCGSDSFSFYLGEDLSYQIQQQHLEFDRLIAQHTERVRSGIEAQRKRFCNRIFSALEQTAGRKLQAKDDEIKQIGKLNFALQEKVKSLSVENQLWRDLAQSNEATANALRSNLEQVMAQINGVDERHVVAAEEEVGESCCGSSGGDGCSAPGVGERVMMCRRCGGEESCVVLLPCRHLCLCTVCGSTVHTCPVCGESKTASVHVNLK